MTDFEKVEKLREKANVSYEEAKAALDEANGDLLDAIIILENQGKTPKPSSEKFTTEPEMENPVTCTNKSEYNRSGNDTKETFRELGRKFRAFINKLIVNFVEISRKENTIIKLPLWIFVLAIILGIHFIPIVIVLSLFFGVRYSFGGKDEMKFANATAEKAEKVAGDVVNIVKDEYNKL